MAICQVRMGNTKAAVTIIDKLINRYDRNDLRYGEALRKKGKILMLQEEMEGKVDKTEALNCYKTYFNLKKKDALARFLGMNSQEREQYWMRIRPFVTDCYRLEDADAGFLYDVTLFAKGLLLQLDSAGGGRQNIHATWQMIQKKLKPDACAIEFIQYEKYGEQQMGALVLKNTGNPVFVKMASADTIWKYEIGDVSIEERLSGTGKSSYYAIDRVYNDSTGLFHMIWNNQLLSVIGDSKIIYFAPDGYMHRIAIEYMFPEESSQRRLYRLSSTRRLLENSISLGDKKALIVGNVSYNEKEALTAGNNDAMAYENMKGLGFGDIKESKAEIDSIILVRNNPSDLLLSEASANEGEFRRLCGEYPIVHLSTHGKLKAKDIPFGTDLKSCTTDESLSENVIALAGVNVALKDNYFNPDRNQDGLLSAKEIASTDMRNTQLVVLACCESGLGQITADGVYGIQRGLKNAGAGAMIISLWEAASQPTLLFMISFHKKIKEGMTVGEAFWETREEMWTKCDEDDQRPCYWNVFVLVDAFE